MTQICTNRGSSATQYKDWIQATQYWVWTLTTIGGLGNLLTILVILHQLCIGYAWKHRPRGSLKRQGSNFHVEKPVLPFEGHTLLLLHLSFCDLLYATVSLPLTATAYGYALDGATQELEGLCPVAAFLRYTNALAEWLTLGLLAFQRCVDLGRWRSARFFQPAATGALIAGIWVVSVALQLVPFAKDNSYGYCRRNLRCDITDDNLRTIFFTLQSFVPLLLMVTGYLGILRHLLRKRKEMEVAMIGPELSRRRLVKSSALVLTLLVLFLVCVIPICIHNVFLGNANDTIRIHSGFVLYMIYWLQYAVNFILYTAMSANFRSAYRRFFGLFLPTCRRESSNVYNVFITQRCSNDTFVEKQERDSRETHTRY